MVVASTEQYYSRALLVHITLNNNATRTFSPVFKVLGRKLVADIRHLALDVSDLGMIDDVIEPLVLRHSSSMHLPTPLSNAAIALVTTIMLCDPKASRQSPERPDSPTLGTF
jgi:hypothetical protein